MTAQDKLDEIEMLIFYWQDRVKIGFIPADNGTQQIDLDTPEAVLKMIIYDITKVTMQS